MGKEKERIKVELSFCIDAAGKILKNLPEDERERARGKMLEAHFDIFKDKCEFRLDQEGSYITTEDAHTPYEHVESHKYTRNFCTNKCNKAKDKCAKESLRYAKTDLYISKENMLKIKNVCSIAYCPLYKNPIK